MPHKLQALGQACKQNSKGDENMREKDQKALQYIAWIGVLFILILALLAAADQAYAAPLLQATSTPTTTPTSTPPAYEVTEINGRNFQLSYEVTIGDIAIVISILFVATILYIFIVVRTTTQKLP